MAMAFCPIGVACEGVIIDGVAGVIAPLGVIAGVAAALGVAEGVAAAEGVAIPATEGVAAGVSSQRDRRLLAEGVGVSDTILSPAPRSVLGVSAQPAP